MGCVRLRPDEGDWDLDATGKFADFGVEISAKMCCGSALNWRENATEKLRKCAEKVIKSDEK